MHLDSSNLNELADAACEAALEAGALIRSYTAGEVAVERKEGGDSLASQVVTRGRRTQPSLDIRAAEDDDGDLRSRLADGRAD
jgi:hypothetical protein